MWILLVRNQRDMVIAMAAATAGCRHLPPPADHQPQPLICCDVLSYGNLVYLFNGLWCRYAILVNHMK